MTDYEPMDMPEVDEGWEGFSGSHTDLEDQTLHQAAVSKLTRKMLPSKFDDSGKAPAIIWTFVLDSGEPVDGTTSEATGPKSKARPWLEALLGKTQTKELLKSGLSKTALVGKRCTVLVTVNDDGYPKVAAVMPPQRAAESPVAPGPTSTPSAAPGPSGGVSGNAGEFDDLPF